MTTFAKTRARPHRTMRNHILFLLVCWGAVLLVIGPHGDFPINDDWAYARDVQHLVEEGRFVFSDWPAMTLIAQTLLGALVCKVIGFSHEALRGTVVVLGIGCTLLVYRLAFVLTGDRRRALLAGLLLLFHPMFLALVVTYMTEVPFMFFTLLSLSFARSWTVGRGDRHYFLAASAGILAMFVRQPGIVLPMVYGAAYLLRSRIDFRRAVLGTLPAVIAIAFLLAFGKWKQMMIATPAQYAPLSALPAALVEGLNAGLVGRAGLSFFMIGLALLPFAAALQPREATFWKPSRAPWTWVALGLAAICMLVVWSRFPEGLILYDLGLGAKVLKDTFWGEHLRGSLPPVVLAMIRGAVFLGVLYLLAVLARQARTIRAAGSDHLPFMGILAAVGGAWAVFLVAYPVFFDRHSLALASITLLIVVVSTTTWRIRWSVAWTVLAVFAVPYCLMLRDHFEWNRTRWAALDHLTKELAVPPDRIDGGFEFNGWHRPGPHRKTLREGISWWFVADDSYLVAAGPVNGFVPLDTFTFRRLVPYSIDTILVLQRTDALVRRVATGSPDVDGRANDNLCHDHPLNARSTAHNHSPR